MYKLNELDMDYVSKAASLSISNYFNVKIQIPSKIKFQKGVNQTTTISLQACRSLMRLQASTAGSRSHQFALLYPPVCYCCL